MDRRQFFECSASRAAGVAAAASLPDALWAADAQPKAYARVLLTNERGDPLRAASLQARTNYVFHYPFEATPVFLLDLGRAVGPAQLSTRDKAAYAWPGGVGARRSIVAFSAICAHQLVYPTKDVSFISFRADRAKAGKADGLIHCCADHSQYDPAQGAQVLAGPATQPLCAVLLAHDTTADTLTAYATLGGELFDEFFAKYAAKLSLDVGPNAKRAVAGGTPVRRLDAFCKNTIQC